MSRAAETLAHRRLGLVMGRRVYGHPSFRR